MRPLCYSINVTLDGCIDHTAVEADPSIHAHATNIIASADAMILGRITYELMESGWRTPNPNLPDWVKPSARPSTR